MYMSNVRVCVDVVGGDEKPQVVLDGIEAALAADPDIEVLAVRRDREPLCRGSRSR